MILGIDQKHYFQIDTLIVSSAFFFLEIKILLGTLILMQISIQLIANSNGLRRRIPRSALQLKRARDATEKMAESYWFTNIPIESLVCELVPSHNY